MSHEHTRQWGMWGCSRTESGCWSIVYDQQSKMWHSGLDLSTQLLRLFISVCCTFLPLLATVWIHGKSSHFVGIFFLLQNWHFFKKKNKHRGNDVENINVKEKKWYLPPHHCTTQHLCTFAIGLPAPAAIRKDRNTGCSKLGKNTSYTLEMETFFLQSVVNTTKNNSLWLETKCCNNFFDYSKCKMHKRTASFPYRSLLPLTSMGKCDFCGQTGPMRSWLPFVTAPLQVPR